ncbi:hypothetical protein HDU81_002572 [Chytriomyces hyalinus]|nr:hypothetical protein HDU81_002572 [Chytriomyces hyalinus]
MSLNNFWTALVAQGPHITLSNTSQGNNFKRRSRAHSEPPFPSRYHDSNSFSISSTSHSGSASSILIQADMLLVSAEKTIVNAAGIIGLASVPKWLFSQLRHYTAPVSAQSFPSSSKAAAPSNLSSSERKDSAKLLPPSNSPATLFIRLNEFGRINQAYPITQFLGQNSQLVMNRFIMRFIYSHDLTRLCSCLSKAMREGASEDYVRWDWRLFNERMADDTDVMSEYEESEDIGETGDEDSDLLDNPFDESDDECHATASPDANDGIPIINVQKMDDSETAGNSTTQKGSPIYDESATLENSDQSKQQKYHTLERKLQLPIASGPVYSLDNEYVDALQPSDETTPYFNETLSTTLDDDPALSAYQSTQPTRRPSFVEPRMPTLAESGTSRSLNGSLLHQRESDSNNEESPSRTPQLVWVRIRIAKSCMVFPKAQSSTGSSIDQDGDEDEGDSSLVCAVTPVPNEDTRVWPQLGDVSDSTLGTVVDGHIAGPWMGCFSGDGTSPGAVGTSRRPRPGIIERVAVGVFGSVLRYALGFRWKGGKFVGRPIPRGVLKRTF